MTCSLQFSLSSVLIDNYNVPLDMSVNLENKKSNRTSNDTIGFCWGNLRERKRPMGRPRRRWADIRMDLQEVGWWGMDWIGLAQDRDRWRAIVSAVMNLRVE
jgi:hypothetical protein